MIAGFHLPTSLLGAPIAPAFPLKRLLIREPMMPPALGFQRLKVASFLMPQNRSGEAFLRKETRFAGRDFKYYKTMLERAEDMAERAEDSHAFRHGDEKATLKVLGILATVALCYCAYVEIKHAAKDDEDAGQETPRVLGLKLGRKTRWTVVGGAINFVPHAQYFAVPAFEKLRAAGENFHERVSRTDAATRPWRTCATFQQKVDWVGVNIF